MDVYLPSRKGIYEQTLTIMITGEVLADNPPKDYRMLNSTMILPIKILIPNLGPPTLKR